MSQNLHNQDRDFVLRTMRLVEAEVNGVIIPQNPTPAATTTETRRIEDDHLVSTVRVSTVLADYGYQPLEIKNLSENINIRGLDDRWRRDDVHRFRMYNGITESEDEDYLTTFTFPHNIIVVRYIQDYRQPNGEELTEAQIIWNSRFSWREIKQYGKGYTHNFHLRAEIIIVHSGEQRLIAEETETGNNISVAVDGLPSIMINEESENGDGMMCPICQDPFSTIEPAKQLPCKHLYHSKCIVLWFCRENSCPICRRQPALPNINPVDSCPICRPQL